MFQLYDISHMCAILFIGAFQFVVWKIPKQYQHHLRLGLAAGLGVIEIVYIVTLVVSGDAPIFSYVPLHISQMNAYLMIATLIRPNMFMSTLIYYWAIWPSLLAVFFPEVSHPFPHIRFFEFFVGYAFLLGSVVYLIRFETVSSSSIHMWRMFGLFVLYGVLVWVVNALFGTNYMFLNQHPSRGQMSFLPQPPWHIPLLALGAWVSFYTLYRIQTVCTRKPTSVV